MLRLILPFLFLTVPGISFVAAQDLHIHYNAYTDSLCFMQNGKPVERPAVRKGNSVVLHVSNYNNYLYDLQIKSQGNQASMARSGGLNIGNLLAASGLNPMKMLFGAGSPLSAIPGLGNIVKSFGAQTGTSDDEQILGFAAAKDKAPESAAERERRALLAEIEKHAAAFDKIHRRLELKEEEIAEIQNDMQATLEAVQLQVFAAEEMRRIRFNPELEPRQIKRLSQEYMVRIFGESDPELLSLDKMLEKTDGPARFGILRQNYHVRLLQYAEEVLAAKAAGAALADTRFDFAGSNVQQFRTEAEKVIDVASGNLIAFRSNEEALNAKFSEIKTLDAKVLSELRTDYMVLLGNEFSRTYRQTAASDKIELRLTFTPVDSVQVKGVTTKAVAPIEINVYGGLQVSAGLGLSFGQFFNKPQSFFVRDSLIQGKEKDAFTPFLSSYVHFYPLTRREVSLGGSFGIGIPIGSSGNGGGIEAITFMLGPSLVLGRSNRIVLSGGLTGGKVSRLASGYAIGDRFEAQPDLLKTESVYQLGYSLGVSFNLLGGN